MPNPVDSLLAQAVASTTVPVPSLEKQQEVLSASAVKQLDFTRLRAARSTGKGSLGVDDQQWDMQNLSAGQIQQKYGPDAAREVERGLVGTREQTEADYQARNARHAGNMAWDTTSGILGGFVGSLGSLGALGLGLIDDDAGAWASDKVQAGTEWLEGTQSDGINAARRQQRLESSLDIADNTFEHEQRLAAGDSEFVSGLRRWGADTIDTLGNSTDPEMFAQGTSEGIGSLLAGGPIAKGLKAAGLGARFLVTGSRAAPASRVGQQIVRAGDWAAWPGAIAGMEAGGAYTGTVSEIMGMPHEYLMENSEPYRELIAQNVSPEDAKLQIATDAGEQAALTQGAVGFATGSLSRWAETPFKVPNFRTGLANVVVKEPLEEGIQGASGAVAQNQAIQAYADETRSLSEGAGEQTALGALYGLGAAGAVQGPGAATAGAIAGAKKAYQATRSVAGSLAERGRIFLEDAEKGSPVSDETINNVAAGAVTQAPQTSAAINAVVESSEGTPEQKAEATRYVQELTDAMTFDAEEFNQTPSMFAEELKGATNRVEAIQRVARAISNAPDQITMLSGAAALTDLMAPIYGLQEADPEALVAIRNNPEQSEALKQLELVVANIETPSVRKALREFNKLVSEQQAQELIQPVTEESLSTPEGQQNFRNAVAVATLHPDKGNLEANEQILTHAANGKLNLSPAQLKSLQASVGLLRARAKLEAEIASKGLKAAKDVVSSQIVASNDPLRKIAMSALQHTKGVLSAMRGRNADLGTARLEDFGKFVQHMQNKVEALNTHFASGDPTGPKVQYSALQPTEDREFKPSRIGMFVNTRSPKSIDQAQSIALEASLLADIYNGLVETFPELNQVKIEAISLAAELEGKPEELVKKFRNPAPTPTPVQEVKSVEQENKTAPKPERATESESFPVQEGAQTESQEEGTRPELTEETDDAAELAKILAEAQAVVENKDEAPKAADESAMVEALSMSEAEYLEAVNPSGKITSESEAEALVEELDELSLPPKAVFLREVNGIEYYRNGNYIFAMSGDRVVGRLASVSTGSISAVSSDFQRRGIATEMAKELMRQNPMQKAGSFSKAGEAARRRAFRQLQEEFGIEPAAEETPTVEQKAPLYNGDRNLFTEAFSEPAEPKTRVQSVDSPVSFVGYALSSAKRLQEIVGGKGVRNKLTSAISEAYESLLSMGTTKGNTLGHLLNNVSNNLESFLESPYSKSDSRKMGQIFREGIEIPKKNGGVFLGREMNRLPRGKVLNLVTEDGETFQYDQGLLEKAGLATMQWLLSAAQFETIMSEQDVSDLTGIPTLYLSDEMIEKISQGMSSDQAVRSLAQKISSYWGLDANPNVDQAYVQGIPQAMAAEMIRGLRDMGLLDVETVKITKEDLRFAENQEPKTIDRYLVTKIEKDNPLRSFQDAIETVVMLEPEHTNYFDEERPPVAERQMNNPEILNTEDQKDALQKEQETPFYYNPTMAKFFASMGVDNLLALFGTVVTDEKDWNKNHLASIEGSNRTISAAYEHMRNVVADLTNTAIALGKRPEEVPVRYAYNMSRVGRMQMLGKYSPQASKLMREVFLPTRSTLDLSSQDTDHWTAYSLGLAQAFGIKVHNMSLQETQNKLGAMLDGELQPAIDMLRSWLKKPGQFSDEQIKQIKDSVEASGADMSMVALHALVDYARLLESKDPAQFTTSVYLEADGVTNGPFNAMALMTIGNFNQDWLRNIRKGGLTIGAAKTLADIRTGGEDDSKDLYQTSTDNTRQRLINLRKRLSDPKEKFGKLAIEQMDHLMSMLDLFNSDIIFDPGKAWDEGGLQMKRGIAKNPLTITVYGSGAAGIGNKLVNAIVTEMYARMSAVVQAQKSDPEISLADAMFPNDPSAQDKMDRFQAAFTALTSNAPSMSFGRLVFEPVSSDRKGFDPSNFTLTPKEFKAFSDNMLQLFVEPMRQGIEDTVGDRLMKAVALVRDATQVQSVVYKYEFQKSLEQTLDDKESNDPKWRAGDFLSRVEQQKISRNLRKVAPIIKTGQQAFMVSSNERVTIDGNSLTISASLDEKMRLGPDTFVPGEAGVRGIPMLTIGMGDGMMMQYLAQQGLEGTLKIFDGMNMPLDKIREQSLKANEAVYESLKGNPLDVTAKSFELFLKNLDMSSINEDTREGLARTLFQDRVSRESATEQDIRDAMNSLLENLKWSARSIDARHKALQSMPLSLDQMAAAGMPYTNGVEITQEMSEADVLSELNRRYEEFMKEEAVETAPSIAPVQKQAPSEPTPEVEKAARVSKTTNARVLTWERLTRIFRNASPTQKEIWGELRRSKVARDYKVIIGSVEQLDAYISEKGLNPRPDQEVFGWTNIGEKTIYMVNPSNETLVHELVHASSYETILNHYSGKSTPEVKDAVERLEALMAEFLEMGTEKMSSELRTAYDSARSAILSSNLEADQAIAQAKALNEFMAWALTNQQISENLRKRQAPKITQLVKSVIAQIKKLIWGRKKALPVADDFLSTLQFNSGIIIRSQPSLAQVARQGELFHAPNYGTSDRLSKIRSALGRKIVDYVAGDRFQKGEQQRQVTLSDAQMTALDVALSVNSHGFSMTPQELSTFRMIVASLATEAEIDPNALARAQELYTHVAKRLTVEDFMADPESLDPAERYYAQQKYDAVMGKHINVKDLKGRSSLLPTFIGLATVDEGFRKILAKMPMPEKAKKTDRSLDSMLENLGNGVMDKLSARLSGDVGSRDVQTSIDNLMEHIRKIAIEEQSLMDKFANKSGGYIDTANKAIKEGMEKLSDLAMGKASQAEKNSKTVLGQAAARMGTLLASIVSEKNGQVVAEQTTVMFNKSNFWEPFQKLMADLVGRTQSNALVYDMIKITRSMVQQVRQQFREETPRVIMSKFKGKMTEGQWTTMYRAMGKTDLALLRDTMSHAAIQKLFTDQATIDTEISTLEQSIQTADPKHWNLLQSKMRQLANYMNTGVPGKNLLRNAEAVSALHMEKVEKGRKLLPANTVTAVDKLITLYAVKALPETDKTVMASLVQGEAEGLSFSLDYLVGQRKEEVSKSLSNPKARINSYKGFIPSEQQAGVSLVVADDAEFARMRERGYIRVGNYKGSSTDTRRSSKGYYFAPLSSRAIFNQGIMQNVRHTAGGVDSVTGYTVGQVAGRIEDRMAVRKAAAQMKYETNDAEALMPVYNEYGQVIALERAIDPVQMQRVQPSQHLPRMTGVWRGRQMEESLSRVYNEKLIDNLKTIYDNDMKESSSNQKQYVNLLSGKLNPVQQDAVNLFTDETLDYIRRVFGEEFWVRKELLDDAVGYRSASVGDLWTGNTRWSKNTQDTVRHMLVGLFGIDAYRYMIKGEQVVQNVMADARTLIVIKSVVVPMVNFSSNIYQLISRGVPVLNIARNMPKKLAEINNYIESNLRLVDAEAELRAAAGDPILERKLKVEIQGIEDGHRRLSIWPLIQAGEFSTIADVGMTSEDLEMSSGKWVQWMEKQVDKLPEAVRNAGRYALITRDTALFQGLQKSVQYGDFVAKAVLYDDLTKRQKVSKKDALGRITEEFVNYDRLPGRFRSYLENMGLLWFYNFKIRISKVAVSTIRNNPLHALIAMGLPTPDFFGTVNLPIEDSLISKVAEGTLDGSIGPGMALNAPSLNPWLNIVN